MYIVADPSKNKTNKTFFRQRLSELSALGSGAASLDAPCWTIGGNNTNTPHDVASQSSFFLLFFPDVGSGSNISCVATHVVVPHPQQRLISPMPHLPPKGGIWACELVDPGDADGRLYTC